MCDKVTPHDPRGPGRQCGECAMQPTCHLLDLFRPTLDPLCSICYGPPCNNYTWVHVHYVHFFCTPYKERTYVCMLSSLHIMTLSSFKRTFNASPRNLHIEIRVFWAIETYISEYKEAP